jgi:hypothetical protein
MELMLANDKMISIYGRPSDIFLTPYNEFNNETLQAMSNLDIHIVSAATYSAYYSGNTVTPWAPNTDQFGIYHAPETVTFGLYSGTHIGWTSLSQMKHLIDAGIKARGWSVVTLHPQDFSKYTPDGQTALNVVNKTSTNRLGGLLNFIHARGYAIASFHDLANSEARQHDDVAPNVTVSPEGGHYTTIVHVGLTADKPSKIYYTIDGSIPTSSSPVYPNKLKISENTTLKFFAVDRDGNISPILTEQYRIEHNVSKSGHGE